MINKRGHIYSETLNNWKYIAGEDLFKVCYPKSYKNSNKFGVSTLLIMVKRGHEVDLEYSKKEIMDRINNFFANSVVERIKFTSFNDEKLIKKEDEPKNYVTKNKSGWSLKSRKILELEKKYQIAKIGRAHV